MMKVSSETMKLTKRLGGPDDSRGGFLEKSPPGRRRQILTVVSDIILAHSVQYVLSMSPISVFSFSLTLQHSHAPTPFFDTGDLVSYVASDMRGQAKNSQPEGGYHLCSDGRWTDTLPLSLPFTLYYAYG